MEGLFMVVEVNCQKIKIFACLTQWLGDDVRVNFRSYGMDPDHSKKMREFGMTSGDRVDSRVYPEFKDSI